MGPHKIDPTNIVYHVVNTRKGIACMFDAQRGACYGPEVELY